VLDLRTQANGSAVTRFQAQVDPDGLRTVVTETLALTTSTVLPPLPVRDTFQAPNRPLGPHWTGTITTDDVGGDAGAISWTQPFSATQGASMTFQAIDLNAEEIDLLLQGQDASPCNVLEASDQPQRGTVPIWTCQTDGDWEQQPLQSTHDITVPFAVGSTSGVMTDAQGTVTVYKNGQAQGSVVVDPSWTYVGQGGQIGLWAITSQQTVLSQFRGGNLSSWHRLSGFHDRAGASGGGEW